MFKENSRMEYDSFVRGMEKVKRCTEKGIEYWMGRDVMPLLAYTDWRNFCGVIEKAKVACATGGLTPANHFVGTNEMVEIGSGAQRERGDYFLTRHACYLIAMNADSSKSEVGFAMTYFAAQTRRQELQEKLLSDDEKRLQLRLRVMENNRRLAGAAKKAGVTRYPIFQDAGYRGMYGGMGVADVKAQKGIPPSEDLLDNISRLELSAHDFRATLTEHRLNREGVSNEQRAIETHRSVGEQVRGVMLRDDGVAPESLRPEPSIKRLVQKHRRALKKGKSS
jgi:DNA-damage-inducible protein D